MTKTIKTNELKELLDKGENFKLVNALSEDNFNLVHIPGSISIPSSSVVEKAEKMLDKNDKIIVYCSNPDCQASVVEAQKLESMGYENVIHYPGGIEEWNNAGLPLKKKN